MKSHSKPEKATSPMIPALVLVAMIGGATFFVYNRSQAETARRGRIELDRDTEFRKFLVKAHLMRSQTRDQGAWNKWLISEGHRPCITCNGSGRAGGADCLRCATFGVEPLKPK